MHPLSEELQLLIRHPLQYRIRYCPHIRLLDAQIQIPWDY